MKRMTITNAEPMLKLVTLEGVLKGEEQFISFAVLVNDKNQTLQQLELDALKQAIALLQSAAAAPTAPTGRLGRGWAGF